MRITVDAQASSEQIKHEIAHQLRQHGDAHPNLNATMMALRDDVTHRLAHSKNQDVTVHIDLTVEISAETPAAHATLRDGHIMQRAEAVPSLAPYAQDFSKPVAEPFANDFVPESLK